jgi:hypothetical protein
MKPEIFVSYSRKDAVQAVEIVARLKSAGFDAWFDRHDINGGDLWREQIVKAVNECSVFLILLSPSSVQSRNVRKELDLADKKGKPVLPLFLSLVDLPGSMEYALAGIQWIDCTRLEAGIEQVLNVLGRQQQGAPLTEFIHRHHVVQQGEQSLSDEFKASRARVYSQFARKLWSQSPEIQFRARQMYSLSHLHSMQVSVSQLKSALERLHYYRGEVNDEFDQKLAAALIHFQLDHGLDPDGISGSLTYKKIVEQLGAA